MNFLGAFAGGDEPVNYEKDIYKAAKHGNIESILYTVAKSPAMLNIQKDDNLYTPLNIACYYGQLSLVYSLLYRGALMEIPDSEGRTPLLNAARKGNFDIAEILIKRGADVNKKDKKLNTALHYAVMAGNSVIASKLLAAHCAPDVPNKLGETPIMYAAKGGYEDLVQMLIDYGADFKRRSNSGWNPLLFAKGDRVKAILRRHGASFSSF